MNEITFDIPTTKKIMFDVARQTGHGLSSSVPSRVRGGYAFVLVSRMSHISYTVTFYEDYEVLVTQNANDEYRSTELGSEILRFNAVGIGIHQVVKDLVYTIKKMNSHLPHGSQSSLPMQELDKIAALVHKGTPCPKCGHKEHTISNPSHPTINQCTKCKHQWNPDNERFKKSGVVVAQELVRIAKSLLANEKLIATNKTWHSWEYDYNDNLASIFMRDDGSLRMTIVSTQRKSGLGAGTWTTPQEDISIGTITNVDWATIRRTLSKYNKKADRATAPFSRAWDVPNTNRSMMLEEIIEKMQGGGVVDEKPDLHTPEVERALKSGIEAYKVDIERIKDSNGNTALKVTMFMPYDVDKFMIDFKWTKRPIRDMLSVSLFLSNDNYGGMRLRFDKYSTVYSWIRGRRPPSGRVYGIKDAINYINKHYVLRGSPYILSQPR